MNPRALLVVGLFALAACGGKQDDPTTGDAGSDGAKADAQPLSPDCPTAQPSDGASCSHDGLSCEYGSDPRYTCNWLATCSSGTWSVSTSNDAYCPTPATNPSACPATYGAAQQGSACTAVDVPCSYAEGWCSCVFVGGPPIPDGGGPDSIWMCGGSLSAGCPASRPRIGTPCTASGVMCAYAPCNTPDGLAVACDPSTGTWNTTFGNMCAGAGSN